MVHVQVMAKVTGLLIGVNGTGKARNREVVNRKLFFFLFFFLFHNSSVMVVDTAL